MKLAAYTGATHLVTLLIFNDLNLSLVNVSLDFIRVKYF